VILAVAITALASTAVLVGLSAAVVELALRNYRQSILASLAVLAAAPLVVIGQNLIALATDLVAASP
jgi:hypothetical protein